MLRYLPLLAAVLACGCAVSPEPTRVERDELAPTGVLRVAVLTGNPVLGREDPVHGDPAGTTAVLGRELARHAGLPVRLIGYADERKLLEDAARDGWDVSGLACAPERALEYALPHMLVSGHGGATGICLVVPGGRRAARSYVEGFMLRAKSQGTVARAIAEAGLQGVRVAP